MFNFNEFKTNIGSVYDWLVKELSIIRTGRATPVILDSVQVDAYGGMMGLRELANIVIEDSRSIKIEPWDMSLIKNIEKSITNSNLGLSVSPYDRGVRIIFPELTTERREQFVKLAKSKLEESRVSLRLFRDKILKEIEEKEKQGGMGEDQKFRLKDEVQKMIDDIGAKLEDITNKKETEIKTQ